MISKLIHKLFLRRHFWRYATFSEVAELYTSRMLRMLAINMSAAFMSVFLYQNGYSILFIAGYWTLYFLVKAFIALPAAKYAAFFGPKHGILLSNLLYIPAILTFTLVPEWGIAAMVITGLLQGASTTLYDLCYLIDFSKVKSVEHAGKEIAYMNIFEKIAKGLSPLIGGLIAFAAGPQATMLAAAILFAFAAVPLFKTGEPLPRHIKLVFRGFPWRATWRNFTAEAAVGVDVIASSIAWPLLVAVVILGAEGNKVYAELGALLSVVLLVALASSYIFGALIDRKRGRELLHISVVVNALTHFTRPLVGTPLSVVGVNVANEVATTGYVMAFTRGMFDSADLSGHRITYLGVIEVAFNIGLTLACLAFFVLVGVLGDTSGMNALFIATGFIVLLIATPNFRLYRK